MLHLAEIKRRSPLGKRPDLSLKKASEAYFMLCS